MFDLAIMRVWDVVEFKPHRRGSWGRSPTQHKVLPPLAFRLRFVLYRRSSPKSRKGLAWVLPLAFKGISSQLSLMSRGAER